MLFFSFCEVMGPPRNNLSNLTWSFDLWPRCPLVTYPCGYAPRGRLARRQNHGVIFVNVISWRPLGKRGGATQRGNGVCDGCWSLGFKVTLQWAKGCENPQQTNWPDGARAILKSAARRPAHVQARPSKGKNSGRDRGPALRTRLKEKCAGK